MNTTERMMIAALFGILMGCVGWLLQTVSTNNGRISVLEQRAQATAEAMRDMRDDIKVHRRFTEGERGIGKFNGE